MASMKRNINEMSKKRRLLLSICLIMILLTSGVKVSYAYYTATGSQQVIANTVTNFDDPNAGSDINVMLYKKDATTGGYVKVNTLSSGTYASHSCVDGDGTAITCVKGGSSGSCYFTVSGVNVSLTAEAKTTCRIFFN